MDRGKQGLKRSLAVDAAGIPLGTVAAPANCHRASLLGPTLDAMVMIDTVTTVHLDRGYDSEVMRALLAERGVGIEIATRGTPKPIAASIRWVVERTTA